MVAGAVVVAAAAVFAVVVVLFLSWLLRRDGAVTYVHRKLVQTNISAT